MAKNEPEPLSEQETRVAIEMAEAQRRLDEAEARRQAALEKQRRD